MQLSSRIVHVAIAACVAALLPLTVHASDNATGHGVARISLLRGDVSLQRGDTHDTIAAAINAPIFASDSLFTGTQARSEVQFDGTSLLRLAEQTQVRFTQLDPRTREVQLAQGTIELTLLRGLAGRPQIDTPSITFRPDSAGRYRVRVTPGGETQLTVRFGRADITTPQGVQVVTTGTTLLADGFATNPVIQSVAAVASDDFDRWNEERDRDIQQTFANAYLSSDIGGTEDLYRYGRWVTDPRYGHVWAPFVADGWAPYRDGRWVWGGDYGWTWIADEPWGWAPYHYGRWYRSPSYGWCWYPPAFALAPVWQPALVGFFTFGPGGGAFGYSNIGWVPLAPGEAYRPWYGFHGRDSGATVANASGNAANQITNVNVRRLYQNALTANGASAVTAQRFTLGRFEQHVVVSPTDLTKGTPVRGALPLVPTRANLRFTPSALGFAKPLTPVVRTLAGATPQPRQPFEQARARTMTEQLHVPATHRTPFVPSSPAPNNQAIAKPVVNARDTARPLPSTRHLPASISSPPTVGTRAAEEAHPRAVERETSRRP